jgi:uncharacterized protein (DUF849 family)
MFEPRQHTTAGALEAFAEAESLLGVAGVRAPRLLHGVDSTAWTLLEIAAERGYAARIGFEDTLTLPNGEMARSNGDLVRAALQRLPLAFARDDG